MAGDKQTQKAGDYSQQIQANTIIVNQGIDEKRAREICTEMFQIAKRDFTQEAMECALNRVQQLEDRLMSRMLPIEGAISSFANPAFQVLLTNAQRTAIATERETDYDMLAELLVCHIEKGNMRKTRAGISKAVEIIDKIDDDALCALTVVHSVNSFLPASPSCKIGIKVLADLFGKLEYMVLPSGIDWIEHLEMLNTIRIIPFNRFKKIDEYYSEQLRNYVAVGIEIGSDNYKKALELLSSVSLSTDYLISNDLMPNYVKLPFDDRNDFKDISLTKSEIINGVIQQYKFDLNDEHKRILKEVLSLYSCDGAVISESKKLLKEEWNRYESLTNLRQWWDALTFQFSITHIGKVLAHTNARRCDKNLPELPLNL